MADILSQEEIDRLLSTAAAALPPEVADLSPSQVGVVERLTRVFFAAANSALATLLTRPASVSDGLGQVVALTDLDNTRHVLWRFPFRSGLSGELVFQLRYGDTAKLADLILGGKGEARETLDEVDRDALRDAMTQVVESGAPNLSSALGREVSLGPPQVLEVGQGDLEKVLGWPRALLCAGNVAIKDILDAPLRLLVPLDVAREMAHLARAGMSSPSDPIASPRTTAGAVPRESPASGAATARRDIHNIDLILEIEVEVMARLGESVMPLKEIQGLRPGSIISLDKDTEAPIELVVNDRVIAKGELVVVGSDHFALRITEVETPTERIRTLGP